MPEEKRSRPQVPIEVRRRLLAEAAMAVMKREGVAAASTRAICRQAGMPHGAFHYCFHSKRELFTTLIEADFDAPLEAAWKEIELDTEPVVGLRILFREYWAGLERDPEHQLVLSELTSYALRDEELREMPIWEHAAYREKISQHLKHFQDQLRISFAIPVEEFAELVLAALSGVTTAWLAHRDGELARRSLDRFAVLFSTQFSPPTGAVRTRSIL